MKKLTLLSGLCILFCTCYFNAAQAQQNNTTSAVNAPLYIPGDHGFTEQSSQNNLNRSNWGQRTLPPSTCKGKKIYIKRGNDNGVYINGTTFNYHPGDTLVLQAYQTPWSYFSLEDFYGTKDCPVTIINEGGQVNMTNGMNIANCRYLRITGTGTTNVKYGFKIEDQYSNGVAIDINGRSAFVEVQNVSIHKKTYGFWIKEEATCVDSLQYPNWTINNIYIHDNSIVKTNQEGMYIGSTDPNGLRGISCNGKTIYPKPLRLANVKVYNNVIDSTNRSGIQLSCGSGYLNEIFNNTISNCGFEFNPDGQGSGISLGGYTRANVYSNNINHTYTMGISSLGSGASLIKDNVVNNSGSLAGRTVNGMASIMIDTRPTTPTDSTFIDLTGNQLGANTDYAIRIYKTYNTYKKGNVLCKNTGNYSIDKGVNWSNVCESWNKALNDGYLQNKSEKNDNLSVYPNPVRDVVHVTLPQQLEGKFNLQVFNAEGNLLVTKTINKVAGSTTEDVNVANLERGYYVIALMGNGKSVRANFFKTEQ